MPKFRTSLARLVDAINEPDPQVRTRALAEVWTSETTLSIDGAVVVTGLAQLDALIVASQDDPRAYVWLVGDHRADRAEWGRWRVKGLDVRPDVFDLRATVDGDGRLTEVRAVRLAENPYAGWREKLEDLTPANLAGLATLLGGALYFSLYLPLSLFYRDLGVAPSDVGFGPQVLIPQSLVLLVLFASWIGIFHLARRPAAAIFDAQEAARRLPPDASAASNTVLRTFRGVSLATIAAAITSFVVTAVAPRHTTVVTELWGLFEGIAAGFALVVVGFVVLWPVAWLLRRHFPEVETQVGMLARRRVRAGTVRADIAALIAATFLFGAVLLVGLPVWALNDADAVRRGGAAGGRITPWRAQPVSLHWTKREHVALTNDCRVLRLLGTGNGQLVLFDTRSDKLFRVPVADASAAVDRECG